MSCIYLRFFLCKNCNIKIAILVESFLAVILSWSYIFYIVTCKSFNTKKASILVVGMSVVGMLIIKAFLSNTFLSVFTFLIAKIVI